MYESLMDAVIERTIFKSGNRFMPNAKYKEAFGKIIPL